MSQGKHLSLSNKTRNALERLDALESDLPRIVSSINGGFTQLNSQLDSLTELVNALIAILGEDQVTKAVTVAREEKEKARVEATKNAISQLVENGQIVAAEAINEKSLIVGHELDADGNVIPPGFVQLQFPQFKEEFREKLLGSGKGFVLMTVEGRSFVVDEVYDFVPPKAEEPVAEETTDSAPVSE